MNVHIKRIKKIQQKFRREKKAAALLVSSAPIKQRSRDTYHPFRQDSDFYYLTGSLVKEHTLLISSKEKTPLLLASPPDAVKTVWEGAPPSSRALARTLGAKLIQSKQIRKELLTALRGIEILYYQNIPGGMSWRITQELLALPAYQRSTYPARFAHSDVVLGPLRLYKEPEEVRLIRAAIDTTFKSITATLPLICPRTQEATIATQIEHQFRLAKAEPAFRTIAATGPSAATLHYEKLTRTLKRGELFLLDCGAEQALYAGDISRVFPVGGSFTPLQAKLYEIVLTAQQAALSKVKAGVRLITVYQAAVRVLTAGLVDLKVLRGKVSTLLHKQAFKPYFPHGIGHSLGLDVHDIGTLRGNHNAALETGMVITIEPGLYFPKKTGSIPACGIRIEDDILVTKNGYKNLSKQIPKEVDKVEEWIGL